MVQSNKYKSRVVGVTFEVGLTTDWDLSVLDICLCLPPDRTWHKVNDLKVDYSGDLGEEKVRHEPRLEPYLAMLLIDPLSAMWAWWAKRDLDPNLVDKGVSDAARLPEGGPAEALSASNLPRSIDRPARMPDSPLKNLCTKQRSFSTHCASETRHHLFLRDTGSHVVRATIQQSVKRILRNVIQMYRKCFINFEMFNRKFEMKRGRRKFAAPTKLQIKIET